MHDCNECKWSAHNLSRLLRLTGERPPRIREMRAILSALGLGDHCWLCQGGVFDHGVFLGRAGKPYALHGFPYFIYPEQYRLLRALRAYPALRVLVDDRPSEYGFGTHRVAIELPEPRTPFSAGRSTTKTRQARRAARAAFQSEGLPVAAGYGPDLSAADVRLADGVAYWETFIANGGTHVDQ